MQIVGGLDIHRGQITFDVLDTVSGEERKGRIGSPDRRRVARWLEQFTGRDVHLVMEGCTGWQQRIHAVLFHHGVALPDAPLRDEGVREELTGPAVKLTPAARQRVMVGYRMMEAASVELEDLRGQLRGYAPTPSMNLSRPAPSNPVSVSTAGRTAKH